MVAIDGQVIPIRSGTGAMGGTAAASPANQSPAQLLPPQADDVGALRAVVTEHQHLEFVRLTQICRPSGKVQVGATHCTQTVAFGRTHVADREEYRGGSRLETWNDVLSLRIERSVGVDPGLAGIGQRQTDVIRRVW